MSTPSPSNYQSIVLELLNQLVQNFGGAVPPVTAPTSYEQRSVELLLALRLATEDLVDQIESGGGGSSGAGLTWQLITAPSTPMEVNTHYLCQGLSLQHLTLPSQANPGDRLVVSGLNNLFRIEQPPHQQVHFNTATTSPGISGRIHSLSPGAVLELAYTSPHAWMVQNSLGNFEVV
jgi:hypothetical protein